MGNRTLITGGAGFLGYHLARHLTDHGFSVTLADNLFRGEMDSDLEDLCKLEKVNFVHCDLTQSAEVERLGHGYEHVYHLAAINGTRYFYEIPHAVLRNNTLSTINVLDWFVKSKSRKIVFASSSETYAGTARAFGVPIPTPEEVPLTVDHPSNPRLSYAGSKIVGELLFINYAPIYHFDMSIVRYHNIYGPRMGREHVIPQFCERIIRRENPFRVYGGEQSRAFCYVSDAVCATRAVMESPRTKGKTIHIGDNREEVAIVDLARRLFDLSGFHPQVEMLSAPTDSVDRRCPDIHLAKELIAYQPRVALEAGLKKTYEWYRRRLMDSESGLIR